MSLRINFVDVIVDNSLTNLYATNNEPVGYQFDIRLSNYRGHYLSTIEEFDVKINGQLIDPTVIRFCINEKEFPITDLKHLRSEYWNLLEPAKIKVISLDKLDGENTIEVNLIIRVPYMPIPIGEHNYVKLDSSGSKTMKARDE